MKKRILALGLVVSFLLTACGSKTAATTMHLMRTEGTVGVSDDGGKDIEPRENLGLYSGYGVDTSSESYAWINLDDVKLTKMDEDSEIAITKDGKHLEIDVVSGNLFFNVTQPLANDESLDIRTSTMIVGIRGTCGWVTQDSAALLEGTVEVTAGEQSVTISAGEMAVLTEDGTLEVKPFTTASIPSFVQEELEADEDLAAAILEDSNTDPGEDSVYPLRVVASKRVFLPDGTLISHDTNEYDESGYAIRSVSTYYDTRDGRETTTVWNYTNDLEAGTRNVTTGHLRGDGSLEEDTIFTSEESLVLGISNWSSVVAAPDDNFISCDAMEGTWPAHLRAEVRANGGRYEYDVPLYAGLYIIYSYGDEGDCPVSSVTYTADGVMTGYAEFEWAVIDP